jgi:hypothetical protein
MKQDKNKGVGEKIMLICLVNKIIVVLLQSEKLNLR